MEEGEASNAYTALDSDPVCPSSPALVQCAGLHTPFTSFVHYVSLAKDISLDFNHGFGFFLWTNSTQCNYPRLFGVLFKDTFFHLELLDALSAFLKV